jgi:hypothetical protein
LPAQSCVFDCGLETCRGRPRQAMSELASLPLCVEHETRRPVMKTGVTRLGRRSAGRTLAAPAVQWRRLAARGGQPGAPARVRGARPDIIELILAYRERIRRLLRKDDEAAGCGVDPGCPEAATLGWCRFCDSRCARTSRRSWECALFAVPGLRRCPDGSTAWTWPSRIRAAVAVRSVGRIQGPNSPGHRPDQRSAPSGRARGADPDTGAHSFGHRRAIADVAAAVLARRIRFYEETTGSERRSCEKLRTARDREARQWIGSSVSRRPS